MLCFDKELVKLPDRLLPVREDGFGGCMPPDLSERQSDLQCVVGASTLLLGDLIMDSESSEAALLDGANQTTAELIQELPGHLELSHPLDEVFHPQGSEPEFVQGSELDDCICTTLRNFHTTALSC